MPRRSGRRTAFPRINLEVVHFAFDHLAAETALASWIFRAEIDATRHRQTAGPG